MELAFEFLIGKDLFWRVFLGTEADELEDPEIRVGVFGRVERFYHTED